ncbi:MAG: leucine-rich repeat domain-containing protein [Candidatus Ozemobacteraceae bacterium]
MKGSFSRIHLGLIILVVALAAGLIGCGRGCDNPVDSQGITTAGTPTAAMVSFPTGFGDGSSLVKLDKPATGLNSYALQVRISGVPSDSAPEATVKAADGSDKLLKKAAIPFAGVVLAAADMELTTIASFQSLTFSQPIPVGARIEVVNADTATTAKDGSTLRASLYTFPVALGTTISGLNAFNLELRIRNIPATSTTSAFFVVTENGLKHTLRWNKSATVTISDGIVMMASELQTVAVDPFDTVRFSEQLKNGAIVELFDLDANRLLTRATVGGSSNHPPAMVAIGTPSANLTNVDVNPLLIAGTFSDPDTGDTHAKSDWEIFDADTGYRVWYKYNDTASKTRILVNAGGSFDTLLKALTRLANSRRYDARVRYYDDKGLAGLWSGKTRFTTKPALSLSPVKPSLTAPSMDAVEVDYQPTLAGTPFNDPNIGDQHSKSDWEVYDNSAAAAANRVWYKTGDATNFVSIAVDSTNGTFENALAAASRLATNTVYWTRVRYYDAQLQPSPWSDLVRFVTLDPVYFPDQVLASAVAEVIGLTKNPRRNWFFKSELTNFQSFQNSDAAPYVTNLSGMEWASNTNLLNLGGGRKIDDLTPIAGLKNLRTLAIYGTGDKDRAPLTTIPLLQSKTLTSITVMYANLNNISGLDNKLYNLTTLDLSWNHITNINALREMTNLQSLNLYYNQVTSLSPLANLTNLTTVEVRNNNLTSLDGLASSTRLDSLMADYNQISDISALSGKTFSALLLSYNQITDLSVFSTITSTTGQVDLSNNRITDLSPLVNNPSFSPAYLNLSGNPLNNPTQLAHIATLRSRIALRRLLMSPS